MQTNQRKGISGLVIAIFLLIVIAIIGGYAALSYVTVETGNSSIIVNSWSGQIRAGPAGPFSQPFQLSPVYEHYLTIYTAVSVVRLCSGYDSTLNENGQPLSTGCDQAAPIAVTKDGIKLAVEVQATWTLSNNPDKLINLYRNYPQLNYESAVIVPTIDKVVRDVIVNKTFNDVFAERSVLPGFIEKEALSRISSNPTLQGIVDFSAAGIQVLNIVMPQSIQDSLQNKLSSQINIITAQNNRNITIINADAARQQQILTAQGQAQAKVISANATRNAIQTVVKSVCPTTLNATAYNSCESQAGTLYLYLLQLQAIAQSNPNIVFIIGQNNGTPYIFQLPLNSSGGSTTTTTTTTATTTG